MNLAGIPIYTKGYSGGRGERNPLQPGILETEHDVMAKLEGIHCPTCGKRGLRAVRRTVTTRVGKRAVTVRGVPLEECPHCGEQLYSLSAMRKIREAREAARASHAA
jgi:YgiT-type zinc finger domain-containing protein